MFRVGEKVECVDTFYCGVKELLGKKGVIAQYNKSPYGDGLDYRVSFNDGKQNYWLAEWEMKKISDCVEAQSEKKI